MTSPESTNALTADQIREVEQTPTCVHCGGRHVRACPRVRSIAYHPNGAIAKVEYWRTWPTEHILFPEDLEQTDPT